MTSESTRTRNPHEESRILEIVESQRPADTGIQIPVARLGCPVPSTALPVVDSRSRKTVEMRKCQRELQEILRIQIPLIKQLHTVSETQSDCIFFLCVNGCK